MPRIWAKRELTAAAILEDDVVMGALGSLTAGSTAAPGWVMEKVGLGNSFVGDGGVAEDEVDDKRGEDRVKIGSTRASGSTSLNRVVGDCCGLLGSGWTVATSSSATATDVPGLAVANNRASAASASPPPLNRGAASEPEPEPVPAPVPALTPEPETAEETDETLLLRLLRPLDINSTSDGRARSCGRRPNMHSFLQSSSVEKMFPFVLGTIVAARVP
ncbi:hypothetical protein PG996_014243 [Apiospora saccharicola]|uniref:Uncharacterized protein n=1 Tax=Apiospora saccharicola TaxID=335842 RepID=A0ABR1THS9_9PEZI